MYRPLIAAVILILLSVAGCATSTDNTSEAATTTVASATGSQAATVSETAPAQPPTVSPGTGPPTPTIPPATAAPPSSKPSTSTAHTNDLLGTIVRFTGPTSTVDVTIVGDNATARSLLSRLPLTVEFEEFNGREKIGYPADGLDVVESGHDSENGELIYYVPWGNLGFYYNAAGIEFDDDVVLLGRYDATPEQLVGLEGMVTISVAID